MAPGPDGLLWVTSPDDGRVVALDPETLDLRRAVAVPDGPAELAWVGARLVVTQSFGGVAVVAGESVTRVEVPCGGTRSVIALDAARALVTCPNDDRVLEVDAARGRTVRVIEAPARPRALAREGDTVWLTAQGARYALSLPRIRAAREGDAWSDPIALPAVLLRRSALAAGAGVDATRADALFADETRGVLGVWEEVDRDSDRGRPASRGGYGSVGDGEPRVAPRMWSPCGDRYAVFDGGPGVLSGPSALAAGAAAVWVVHRGTGNVAALRCERRGARATGAVQRLGTWRVGRGARGIVVSPDGRDAWVDVGDERALARLSLDDARGDRVLEPRAVRRRAAGEGALDDLLVRGRSVFFDASDTHLTPSGIVACATCHPDGGDDGLAWFLHADGVARKIRRTPPAWAGRPSLAPYHWDGEFRDLPTLARATIRALMGGDALLVDVDAMAAWLAWLPPPPPRPLSPAQRARADRGRERFARAGCGDCHRGDDYTDNAAHDVVAPSLDPDGRMPAALTPTLRGVRARAPYLHDGRAGTLRELLTTHNPDERHGRTRSLSPSEIDDLVWFLQTL